MPEKYPVLRAIVLDAVDARELAEFYRQLLGYRYRPGHEANDPSGDDWLVLDDTAGEARLAIQRVDQLPASTWPDASIPQQLHLDLTVDSTDDLVEQRDRALSMGATILEDRFDNPDEPLYVFADPAGHPFCIFVVPPRH
ncbi:MAG: VOC family protein [Actinobacteria bacterium]|nr:VOC family protein [Actinomycetota bacterium]